MGWERDKQIIVFRSLRTEWKLVACFMYIYSELEGSRLRFQLFSHAITPSVSIPTTVLSLSAPLNMNGSAGSRQAAGKQAVSDTLKLTELAFVADF